MWERWEETRGCADGKLWYFLWDGEMWEAWGGEGRGGDAEQNKKSVDRGRAEGVGQI